MKIIFSPSKTQKITNDICTKENALVFKDKSQEIIQVINSLDISEIEKIYSLNTNKAGIVIDNFANHHNLKKIPAIELFTGTSFKELNLHSYNRIQQNYLQNHLRIFSAPYGVLRPADCIPTYRLDMNNNIFNNTKKYKNMYDFWQKDITEYFANEDMIINLASGEYSKILEEVDPVKIITMHFVVLKEGKQKSISVYSKQQRGKMLDFMVQRVVTSAIALQGYSCDGFIFDAAQSNESNYYYIKEVK